MALLHTHAEIAQMLQDTYVKIIAEPNASFSVLGQSFTTHNIETLNRLIEYHNKKATIATHGRRTTPDFSTA